MPTVIAHNVSELMACVRVHNIGATPHKKKCRNTEGKTKLYGISLVHIKGNRKRITAFTYNKTCGFIHSKMR